MNTIREDGLPPLVLKTLLVSDLVGSTRLTESLGDRAAAELNQRHDRLARDLLAAHEGREIDKTDGFLHLFERPLDALRYALEYHLGLRRLSQEEDLEVQARVGIHVGEVLLRENPPEDVARGAKPLEVEGLAKPMTGRLMSLAGGGQTLLTRGAFDLARRGAVGALDDEPLSWLAHGGYLFQGVAEPIEVFEVGREGMAPLAPPADSAKVRRVVEQTTIPGWRPAPGLGIPHRGHWVLKEKLGEGGFGEAWLAAQEKTRDRRVFKFCYDPASLRTLQREITLFRLLKEELGERDDITRIVDWSFEEAPYFVESEYTEGGNLGTWAEEQSGLSAVPMATRLEIVAQVATALAAAHSVGVLHKDVKPSNVLIATPEGQPRARLSDSGVGAVTEAKRLAEAGITMLGLTACSEAISTPSSLSGTRIYTAPEVYALGVMLYQVVVGDLTRALAPGWRRDVTDELLAEDIGTARGTALTVRELLDRGRDKLLEAEDLADDPRTRARLMATLGVVYRNLGHYDEARPLLEKALALRRRVFGDEHTEVADSRDALATLVKETGDLDRAELLYREALAMNRRLSTKPWRSTPRFSRRTTGASRPLRAFVARSSPHSDATKKPSRCWSRAIPSCATARVRAPPTPATLSSVSSRSTTPGAGRSRRPITGHGWNRADRPPGRTV